MLNQRDASGGEFPLHVAVRRGLEELSAMMLKSGAKANCSNVHGLTPLHYAARKGDVNMISLLLSHGASLSQVESFFWTPLHYAAFHGNSEAVAKLLEAASSNVAMGGNNLVNETDSMARSALHIACRVGSLPIATQLLAAGAKMQKDSTGHAPFYYLSVKDAASSKDESPELYLDVEYAEASSSQLCSDIRALYESGELSDVTFVVSGLPEPNENGELPADAQPTIKEYKAHKAIIHARAPALLTEQAPFRTIVEGSGNSKMAISGLTHALFAAILEYIYSGGIAFKETDLDFVFNLAKKGREFALPALSSFAESMILSNLSEDNVVSILEAATVVGCCPRVENYCRYYIVRHYDKVAQAAGQEEMDKISAAQFVSVLPRLSLTQETSAPITSIEKPPTDFQQSKGTPLHEAVGKTGVLLGSTYPAHAMMGQQAYQPGVSGGPPMSYGVGAPASTPKQSKPKKTKTPKSSESKMAAAVAAGANADSPRGMMSGSVRASGGVSASPASPPEVLAGKTMELTKKLHKELLNEQDSHIFATRVDYEAMGLADYPWIIKKPMDLSTVWKNLTSGRVYKTIADWAHDIRLIWDNARTYNAPESEVYIAAERLSKMFETSYANIQRSLDISGFDPYIPKPIEWYVNTYARHWEEYRAANPQLVVNNVVGVTGGPAALHGAPPSGLPSSALPPHLDPYGTMALNKPPVPAAAPKKTRAQPPAVAPQGAYGMGATPTASTATSLANANVPPANRKRRADGSDEFEAMHPPQHTSMPPGASAMGYHAPANNAASVGAPSNNGAAPSYPPQGQIPQQPMQATTISLQQQQRMQERLEQLNEAQGNEVIKLLDIQPNAEGEFEILIENMPLEIVRVLENYLVSVTGPF